MLTYSTKQKLAELLLELSQQEKQLHVLRQILYEQIKFDPLKAFKRIDKAKKDEINANDLMNFLIMNEFEYKEDEIEEFIRYYGRDGSDGWDYGEFSLFIIPSDHSPSRTIPTHNKVYEATHQGDLLPYEVEYALAKLFSRGIAYNLKLEGMKIDLTNQQDFTLYNSFSTIDFDELGYITHTSLKIFFKTNGKSPKNEDILRILHKLDLDNDERITYEEFSQGIRPHKHINTDIKNDNTSNSVYYPRHKRAQTTCMISYSEDKALEEPSRPLDISKSSMMNYLSANKEILRETMSLICKPRSKSRRRLSAIVGSTTSTMTATPNMSTKESFMKDNTNIFKNHQLDKSFGPRLSVQLNTNNNPNKSFSIINNEDTKKEFARILNEMVHLEREIELKKENLALRADYNLYDIYKLFDRKAKGIISVMEIKQTLNEMRIYPNKEDIYLLIRRFDKYGDNKLRFIDFCDAFKPIQSEYAQLIKNRLPRDYKATATADTDYDDDGNSKDQKKGFSDETSNLLRNLLVKHIENEAIIEALRQKLSHKAKQFHPYSLFKDLDTNNDGYLGNHELKDGLDKYNVYLKDKEVSCLINRFDKNHHKKISYSEFVQELMPKSKKKYQDFMLRGKQ